MFTFVFFAFWPRLLAPTLPAPLPHWPASVLTLPAAPVLFTIEPALHTTPSVSLSLTSFSPTPTNATTSSLPAIWTTWPVEPSSSLTPAPSLAKPRALAFLAPTMTPSPTLLVVAAALPSPTVASAPLGADAVHRPSPSGSPAPVSSSTHSSAAPRPSSVGAPVPLGRLHASYAMGGMTFVPATTTKKAVLQPTAAPILHKPVVKKLKAVLVRKPTSPIPFVGPRLPMSPIGTYNGTEIPTNHLFLCLRSHRPVHVRYKLAASPRRFGLASSSGRALPAYVSNPASIHTPFSLFLVKEEEEELQDPEIDLGPILALAAAPRVKSTSTRIKCECQGEQHKEPLWQKVLSIGFTTLFVVALYFGPPPDKDGAVANNFVDAVVEYFDVYAQWAAEVLSHPQESFTKTLNWFYMGFTTSLSTAVDFANSSWYHQRPAPGPLRTVAGRRIGAPRPARTVASSAEQ
ncbi:hypothetical protein DXG01_006427 [Tephrocybe rancida]|nr:hypothetical protein DXG01_006427 [Tephrocybe rancida]